jgi:hypothetical protein
MSSAFTLRSRFSVVSLSAVALAALLVAVTLPPALWLCVVGGVLLVAALTANSARTGQWFSWQNEGSLSQPEGFLASTGIVLTVIPLFVVLLKSWLA